MDLYAKYVTKRKDNRKKAYEKSKKKKMLEKMVMESINDSILSTMKVNMNREELLAENELEKVMLVKDIKLTHFHKRELIILKKAYVDNIDSVTDGFPVGVVPHEKATETEGRLNRQESQRKEERSQSTKDVLASFCKSNASFFPNHQPVNQALDTPSLVLGIPLSNTSCECGPHERITNGDEGQGKNQGSNCDEDLPSAIILQDASPARQDNEVIQNASDPVIPPSITVSVPLIVYPYVLPHFPFYNVGLKHCNNSCWLDTETLLFFMMIKTCNLERIFENEYKENEEDDLKYFQYHLTALFRSYESCLATSRANLKVLNPSCMAKFRKLVAKRSLYSRFNKGKYESVNFLLEHLVEVDSRNQNYFLNIGDTLFAGDYFDCIVRRSFNNSRRVLHHFNGQHILRLTFCLRKEEAVITPSLFLHINGFKYVMYGRVFFVDNSHFNMIFLNGQEVHKFDDNKNNGKFFISSLEDLLCPLIYNTDNIMYYVRLNDNDAKNEMIQVDSENGDDSFFYIPEDEHVDLEDWQDMASVFTEIPDSGIIATRPNSSIKESIPNAILESIVVELETSVFNSYLLLERGLTKEDMNSIHTDNLTSNATLQLLLFNVLSYTSFHDTLAIFMMTDQHFSFYSDIVNELLKKQSLSKLLIFYISNLKIKFYTLNLKTKIIITYALHNDSDVPIENDVRLFYLSIIKEVDLRSTVYKFKCTDDRGKNVNYLFQVIKIVENVNCDMKDLSTFKINIYEILTKIRDSSLKEAVSFYFKSIVKKKSFLMKRIQNFYSKSFGANIEDIPDNNGNSYASDVSSDCSNDSQDSTLNLPSLENSDQIDIQFIQKDFDEDAILEYFNNASEKLLHSYPYNYTNAKSCLPVSQWNSKASKYKSNINKHPEEILEFFFNFTSKITFNTPSSHPTIHISMDLDSFLYTTKNLNITSDVDLQFKYLNDNSKLAFDNYLKVKIGKEQFKLAQIPNFTLATTNRWNILIFFPSLIAKEQNGIHWKNSISFQDFKLFYNEYLLPALYQVSPEIFKCKDITDYINIFRNQRGQVGHVPGISVDNQSFLLAMELVQYNVSVSTVHTKFKNFFFHMNCKGIKNLFNSERDQDIFEKANHSIYNIFNCINMFSQEHFYVDVGYTIHVKDTGNEAFSLKFNIPQLCSFIEAIQGTSIKKDYFSLIGELGGARCKISSKATCNFIYAQFYLNLKNSYTHNLRKADFFDFSVDDIFNFSGKFTSKLQIFESITSGLLNSNLNARAEIRALGKTSRVVGESFQRLLYQSIGNIMQIIATEDILSFVEHRAFSYTFLASYYSMAASLFNNADKLYIRNQFNFHLNALISRPDVDWGKKIHFDEMGDSFLTYNIPHVPILKKALLVKVAYKESLDYAIQCDDVFKKYLSNPDEFVNNTFVNLKKLLVQSIPKPQEFLKKKVKKELKLDIFKEDKIELRFIKQDEFDALFSKFFPHAFNQSFFSLTLLEKSNVYLEDHFKLLDSVLLSSRLRKSYFERLNDSFFKLPFIPSITKTSLWFMNSRKKLLKLNILYDNTNEFDIEHFIDEKFNSANEKLYLIKFKNYFKPCWILESKLGDNFNEDRIVFKKEDSIADVSENVLPNIEDTRKRKLVQHSKTSKRLNIEKLPIPQVIVPAVKRNSQFDPFIVKSHCSFETLELLGIGSFGSVYKFGDGNIIKIIPINMDLDQTKKISAEEKSKGIYFSLARNEAIVSRALATVNCSNFCKLNSATFYECPFPISIINNVDDVIQLYAKTDEEFKAHRDEFVLKLSSCKYFACLEYENAGTELMEFDIPDKPTLISIIKQVLYSLWLAQLEMNFEHRDLHSGNILILPCSQIQSIEYKFNEVVYTVETRGILVKIIDFSFSRVNSTEYKSFFNLELLKGILDFSNKSNYFKMKKVLKSNWDSTNFTTTKYWLLDFFGNLPLQELGMSLSDMEEVLIIVKFFNTKYYNEFRKFFVKLLNE